MKLIIIGGGIMGCSTAYYAKKLHEASNSEEPLEIFIVERKAVASCASGKAGGFLARNWAAGALKPLATLSFDMHRELAEEVGADKFQYRPINSISGHYTRPKAKASAQQHGRNQRKNKNIFANAFDTSKLKPGQLLGNTETTAQVTPWFLTNFFFKGSGATLIKAELVGVKYHKTDSQRIMGVVIKSENKETGEQRLELLQGDEFCFCLGVWTHLLRKMKLRVPNSIGRKIHSVVIRPRPDLAATLSYLNMAIFTDHYNIEIIIREKGVVYLNRSETGFEKVPLKDEATAPDEEACDTILAFWEHITKKSTQSSAGFRDVSGSTVGDEIDEFSEPPETETKVLFKQACHLPMVEHDYKGQQLPIMSRVPRTSNGFICSGHTCWGILLAPVCGQIMSQLILNNDPNKIIDTTPFQLRK